ncbi:transposase [Streptomyces sp. NBC_01693]
MERGDLTDEQWVMLEPLLPKGMRTEGGCPSRLGGG